ncbi:MAG: hypothetical protein KH420_02125 [Clostridiales bacterium]|nr:hypothetical protein [Clostridiales bacterium]
MRRQLPVMLIVTVLTGLVAIGCLVQVVELDDQVRRMERSLSDQQTRLQDTVSSQYYAIRDLLEEQTSLISDSSFSYSKIDLQQMTAEFCCTVTPKQFTPGKTTAAVVIGGTQYPMELENGSFVARVDWPLFEDLELTQVLFWTDGVQQAQAMDWYSTPRYDALPTIYAYFSGDGSGTTKYHVEGELQVEISPPMDQMVAFESIDLVALVDGEEVRRESFAEAEGYYDGAYYSSSQYLDQDYEIPQGAAFELYVEVADGTGLYHRVSVLRRGQNETGLRPEVGGEASIYDADGKLLFSPILHG